MMMKMGMRQGRAFGTEIRVLDEIMKSLKYTICLVLHNNYVETYSGCLIVVRGGSQPVKAEATGSQPIRLFAPGKLRPSRRSVAEGMMIMKWGHRGAVLQISWHLPYD